MSELHQTPSLPRPCVPQATVDGTASECLLANDTSCPTGDSSVVLGPIPLRLDRLKHYRLLELVGRGGMGEVYRAHDEMFQRPVAIKVLPADLAEDEQFVRRFQREAKAIAGLSHPNIVPIYAIDRDQGLGFYAMQLIAGESLEHRLRRVGKLPWPLALHVISSCLAALEAAHTQGLIHRDVKPGNVLIQENTEHIFLVDFGLVRRHQDQSLLTATGMVMGTVDYMAPEQARGCKEIDPRADLYSVGAMLYHLLSGHLPFEARSLSDKLYCHAYESPRPLAELAPEIPADIVQLVESLMAKRPADRPASATSVLALLAPMQNICFRREHFAQQIARLPPLSPLPERLAQLPAAFSRWQGGCDQIAKLLSLRSQAWWEERRTLERQLGHELEQLQRRQQHLTLLCREGQELRAELEQRHSLTAALDGAVASPLAPLQTQQTQLASYSASIDDLLQQLTNRQSALGQRLATASSSPSRTGHWRIALTGLAAICLVVSGAFYFRPAQPPPKLDDNGVVPPDSLTRLEPGQVFDLLPLIDPARDTVAGVWKVASDGALYGQGGLALQGHTRLQIPIYPHGSYQLTARVSRQDSDVNLIFPAGGWSARAMFGTEPEGTLHHSSRPERPGLVRRVLTLPWDGTSRDVRVKVEPIPEEPNRVHVQVFVEEQLTYDWIGNGKELANNAPCAIPDPSAVGLSISGNKATFHQLRIEMLTGYADIRWPQPSQPPAGGAVASTQPFVAHYRFQDGRGLYAHDLPGGQDGRLVGVQWSSGFADGALQFSGNDHLQLPRAMLNRQTNYTLTAWLRHDNANDEFEIYADHTNHVSHSRFFIDKQDRFQAHWQGQSAADDGVSYPLPAPPGAWFFVAARFTQTDGDAGKLKVWINDQSREDAFRMIDAKSANQARVGHGSRGAIEDLRIYHRALSDQEIADIYAALAPRASRANLRSGPAPSSTANIDLSQSSLVQPLAKLQEAIARDPNNPAWYRQRARWHAARQQWRAAASDMEAFLQKVPDDAQFRAMLLTVYVYLEDAAQIANHREVLARELATSSNDNWATWEIIRALLLAPNTNPELLSLAEKHIEAALQDNPGHTIQHWRGLLYFRQGRWQDCLASEQSAPHERPYFMTPRFYRAAALQHLNRREDALSMFDEARDNCLAYRYETSGYDAAQASEHRIWWWSTDGMHAQIAHREAARLLKYDTTDFKLAHPDGISDR